MLNASVLANDDETAVERDLKLVLGVRAVTDYCSEKRQRYLEQDFPYIAGAIVVPFAGVMAHFFLMLVGNCSGFERYEGCYTH